jgi:hypothetical protein
MDRAIGLNIGVEHAGEGQVLGEEWLDVGDGDLAGIEAEMEQGVGVE